MEDDFCAGRPDWERVGATFSDRVHDYEAMKLRMLNAGHQVLANAGEILSVETVSGCMAHPLIRALFRRVEHEEIVPHVEPVPDATPETLSRPSRAPVLESRHRGHDAARRLRRIVAPPGLRPADSPRRPPDRRAGGGACAGRGVVGAHVRGHARGRLRHRAERLRAGTRSRPPQGRRGSVRARGWSSAGSMATSSRRHASWRRSSAGCTESWSDGCEAALAAYAAGWPPDGARRTADATRTRHGP